MQYKPKNRSVAVLLCFFLGGIGAHKFYLNKVGMGVLYLLFAWTFVPLFVSFIEFIFLLAIGEKGFDERYNHEILRQFHAQGYETAKAEVQETQKG